MRNSLAFDCDGTIFADAFPGIGAVEDIHKLAHEYIRMRHAQGWACIIWTCRENIPDKGNYLDDAINFCKENDIPFDYVNENPEGDFGRPDLVRKIWCTEYLDDKAVNPLSLQTHI